MIYVKILECLNKLIKLANYIVFKMFKCMSLLILTGIKCQYWVDCHCKCFPFVVPLLRHWME